MKNALAILAAILATLCAVPYLLDIVRGKTKPNIVTWLTWTLLTGIATAAAFAAGQPRTALLTLGSTVCTALVVAFGLFYGKANFSRFDVLCQLGALAGLGAWLLFDSPLIGIIIPVTIDFIGALPTVRHSWLRPAEETWQTFVINLVASVLTIASLKHFGVAALLYPVYLVVVDGTIAAVIMYRRKIARVA